MKEKKKKGSGTGRSAYIKNVSLWCLVLVFFIGIIVAFYFMLVREKRNSVILAGKNTAQQTEAEMNEYLASSIDAIRLTAYAVNGMLEEHRSESEIQAYMVSQTNVVKSVIFENTEGLYGYIEGKYYDGAYWDPGEDYVPTERPWYIKAIEKTGQVAVVDP